MFEGKQAGFKTLLQICYGKRKKSWKEFRKCKRRILLRLYQYHIEILYGDL